jgi:hypothetical protein
VIGRRSRPSFGRARQVALAIGITALAGFGAAVAKDAPIAAPAPDLAFFAKKIAPFLEEKCVSCHGAGAGQLALRNPAKKTTDASGLTIEAFNASKRFLDAEAPWNSRLIRKVIAEEEGGLPHGGGALIHPSDDIYDDLLDFAAGATATNLPPEPEPGKDRRIPLGDAVELDGSLSYDRDDDKLTFRWTLKARPPGSKAVLTGASDPKASMKADLPGTYVVTLRVFDGKLWSGAKPVVLECLERTGPSVPDAVAASGLAELAPAVLQRVRAVYGDVLARPPTPPETLSSKDRPTTDLANLLLSTLEAGRAYTEDAAWRLGLVGDAEPLSDAVGELPARFAAGEVSPAAAESILAHDPSFLRAHPPGASLARAVAELLLGRTIVGDERETLGSPAGLEKALASEEFALAALGRWARRFLGPADADAVPAARAKESLVALAKSFVASAAYAGVRAERRRASDPAFVRALFADLLGRRPTTKELVALSSAAAVLPGSSAGRAAVVDVVLDSGEVPLPLIVDLSDPDAWIADRFLRYIGRAPMAPEAKVFRTALMDPDGGPHVVIRALLTGAEYASR